MATNRFFNNFPKNVTGEQLLMESLVIEALQMFGMDVYYLSRGSQDSVDYLYGEDQLKQYTSAYQVEMYLENVTGMEGEGDFMSKFGLEIRDELQLLVSRRRFSEVTSQFRPLEGDLIYIPLVQNFFEISFVEHENNQAMFYTLGRGRGGNVYVYSLKLKQFVFSNEIIETGVQEVDEQIRDHYPRTRIYLSDINGTFLKDEVVYQGNTYNTRTSEALVYESIPGSGIDVYRTHGDFSGSSLIANTSGTTANVTSHSDTVTMDDHFEDIVDNNRIEVESDLVIDFTDNNPFGEA